MRETGIGASRHPIPSDRTKVSIPYEIPASPCIRHEERATVRSKTNAKLVPDPNENARIADATR